MALAVASDVAETWLSQLVGRLLRGTIMRHVIADPADPRAIFGASKRGTWWTVDGGTTWHEVRFEGEPRPPMVFAIVPAFAAAMSQFVGERSSDPFAGAWRATDDGLWVTGERGRSARRAALAGMYVNSLTRGAGPSELVGVIHKRGLFRLETARTPFEPRSIDLVDVRVVGLPGWADLFGFTFDLHFGEALLQRATALKVNDFAGLALVLSPLTGAIYWWLPRRRSRSRAQDVIANLTGRRLMDWVYRFHAPVVGLLAAIPMLYLSVTGAVLGHVEWFQGWAKEIELQRERLLWTYRFISLEHEAYQVVADLRNRERVTIATRLGLLETVDGGRSWRHDPDLAAARFNLFRASHYVFASLSAGEPSWQPITGPATGLTSGNRCSSRRRSRYQRLLVRLSFGSQCTSIRATSSARTSAG